MQNYEPSYIGAIRQWAAVGRKNIRTISMINGRYQMYNSNNLDQDRLDDRKKLRERTFRV